MSLNERGFSLIIIVLIVSVFSIMIATFISNSSISVARAQKVYDRQLIRDNFETELTTIFSNVTLCTSLISLVPDSDRFTISHGIIDPSMLYSGGLKVLDLQLINRTLNADGYTHADAQISFHDVQKMGVKSLLVGVRFKVDATGSISDCRARYSPEVICRALGLTWYETESRCGICEKTGGVWEAGTCRRT
jgi:hypothetical protein